jgi:transposase
LEFATRWLNEDLGNVIWSDETSVASHPNNRKVQVWTNLGEVPIQVKMHSGGNAVMFWGCMSMHGTGPLQSILGFMNGDIYKEILSESVFPELAAGRAVGDIAGPWRFMQDNAPCHKRRDVMELLEANEANVIDWPPYSPDLNPIEHVWHWIKHEMEVEYPVPNSAEEIESNVMEIWRSITPDMCANWCYNYNKRLEAVVLARGGYTKY